MYTVSTADILSSKLFGHFYICVDFTGKILTQLVRNLPQTCLATLAQEFVENIYKNYTIAVN